jgi:hypothetical protein
MDRRKYAAGSAIHNIQDKRLHRFLFSKVAMAIGKTVGIQPTVPKVNHSPCGRMRSCGHPRSLFQGGSKGHQNHSDGLDLPVCAGDNSLQVFVEKGHREGRIAMVGTPPNHPLRDKLASHGRQRSDLPADVRFIMVYNKIIISLNPL